MSDPSKERLLSAARRLDDLRALNNGDLAGAPQDERQQLIQEFFFHLVGAIDFLAQHINIARELGLDAETVTVDTVCAKLGKDDEVRKLLKMLHPRTRRKNLPPDPYSEEGSHFRIVLVRHCVCHLRAQPFHFKMDGSRKASLFLDPRRQRSDVSKRAALCELQLFHGLVLEKHDQIVAML